MPLAGNSTARYANRQRFHSTFMQYIDDKRASVRAMRRRERRGRTGEESKMRSMPADIDPESGFRLPVPRREDLDETGKKLYDRATTP
jgi:hypothetical protein